MWNMNMRVISLDCKQHPEHVQRKFLFIFSPMSSTCFIKDKVLFHRAADNLRLLLLKKWWNDYVLGGVGASVYA